MPVPKVKYSVYLLEIGTGCYKGYRCRHVGDTWAKSEKQAVSNVSYRTGILANDWAGDYLEEGELTKELRACLTSRSTQTLKEWRNRYDQTI